ncbi:hypothetical protein [Clostridium sp. DL1XJH146]
MEDIKSQQQRNINNIPNFYETNDFFSGGIDYKLNNLSDYTGNIPNLHSISESFDNNEKLKEIFKNNHFLE